MKAVRSWSKPEGKPDLMARKQIDLSVLEQGATIPLEFIQEFDAANQGAHINRGENRAITLVVGEQRYEGRLENVKRQVQSDTYRIMWRGDFRLLLSETFSFSRKYLARTRAAQGDSGNVSVPEGLAEFIEFYKTDKPFQYRVDMLPRVADRVITLFREYVKTSSLQYSYKLVLLRAMLQSIGPDGGAEIEAISDAFGSFYLNRVEQGLPADRPGGVISNIKLMGARAIQSLIIDNPFNAYSRANWMHRVGSRIALVPELWSVMTEVDCDELSDLVEERLLEYYRQRVDTGVLLREGGEGVGKVRDMLSVVEQCICSRGFQYSYEDLCNFYLCLRTKPFVILAGISGTGKSQLPKLFAEAISGAWMPIAVRPDWNDGSDLLGYVDLQGSFRPGALTRAIEQANRVPDKPMIVVLDEMNLARVEYYMSDLLSVMETREKDEETSLHKTESLFTRNGEFNDQDRERYEALYLPDNLYLVGTVNMDETTHPFSKKVLDRANTIEFSDVDLTGYRSQPAEAAEPVNLSNRQLKGDCIHLSHALAIDKPYVDSIVDKLVDINHVLAQANLHIGYRVRDEVSIYMLYNHQLALLDEDTAFDYQLMQKILPRIQGSTQPIRQVLLQLLKICGADYTNTNDDLLGKLREFETRGTVKPYPRSATKLVSMLRRFEEDGFTSYWI